MLKIPVGKETFTKSFLNGKGNLELKTDQDAWKALWDNDGVFTEDVDKIAELSISGGTGEKEVKLGERDNLNLTVSAKGEMSGVIDLIWPLEKESNEYIKNYDLGAHLTADQLYLRFSLGGSLGASAKAKIPSGALSAGGSVGVGASAGYTLMKPYDQGQGARTILEDLFEGLYLPQRVDTVEEIPEAGEVVSLSYGGYLNLGASLNWGYQLNGVKGWQSGGLDLNFSYLVKAAASMSLDYKLAGQHMLTARRGHDDGWVRFVVNKKRDSTLAFAADLGIDASVDMEGLPETADEFLAALLGTDVGSVLVYLREARKYDSLAEIRDKLDSLATSALNDLSKKWVGKALSNATVERFLEAAQEVLETYDNLDQQLVSLYEGYVGTASEVAKLRGLFDDLARVTSREALVSWAQGNLPDGVKDSDAFDLIKDELGDDLYDALLDNEAFSRLRRWILAGQEFLNGGSEKKIRDLINEVKKKLGIEGLISKIRKYSSAEALQAEADDKISALVSRIIGEQFDQLEGTKLDKAFKKLESFLDKIESFKTKWYEKLVAASKQSVSMQVAYNYTRTRAKDSLIDIEVNLADERGPELAQAASKGDFAGALKAYDPRVVRVNPGTRLTRSLQSASQLQVNLYGRNFSRTVDIVQNMERYVESVDGGLVHVYELDTKVDVTKKSNQESQASSFLIESVGQVVQPAGADAPNDPRGRFLLRTLSRMSVNYQMTQTDRDTTFKEMRAYLTLGNELGLVSDLDATMAQLEDEFPAGLGVVEATYVVRFDSDDVATVFKADNVEQRADARVTARKVIASSLLSAPPNDPRFAIGAGYYSGKADRFLPHMPTVRVTVPAAFRVEGGDSRVYVRRAWMPVVNTLFNVEDKYVKRFIKLDDLVDRMRSEGRPVPVKELQDASLDFAKLNATLEKFSFGHQRVNVFFVLFDRLARASTGSRSLRQSVLSVSITPPGGEKVTKMFVDAGTQPLEGAVA